jgi:hypothetical protein
MALRFRTGGGCLAHSRPSALWVWVATFGRRESISDKYCFFFQLLKIKNSDTLQIDIATAVFVEYPTCFRLERAWWRQVTKSSMNMAFQPGMSPFTENRRAEEHPMYDQFLTFKLDLMKSEMINQANIAYKAARGL